MKKVTRLMCALLVWLAAATGFSTSAQINTDQVMRMGQNAYFFEDYMVAIHYFNMVIGAKPYLAEPYFFRGLCKLQLDDYAGVEQDVTEALHRHAFIKDAHEVRGVARQNLGKFSDAIVDYDSALIVKPDNRNVIYNRALALIAVKDYDKAHCAFDTIVKRWPEFEGGYSGRANLFLHMGDTIAALVDLDSAIVRNPNVGNIYLMRAEINVNRGHYAEALPDMDYAIKLLPRRAGLFINRAFVRYQEYDFRGAMSDFDVALEMEPDNLVALYNRAMLRTQVHDYNRAIEDFTGVLRQNPDHHRARFNRSNLYREIGDYDNALNDIDMVIKAFPTFATATYMRGDILYRRGNRAAAEREYKKAVELAKRRVTVLPDSDIGGGGKEYDESADIFSESQEEVKERFTSMLRVENTVENTPRRYGETGSSRGTIQNTNFVIELEPVMTLTFYTEDTELRNTLDLEREIDRINNSGILRGTLFSSVRPPVITDEETVKRHEYSIDYYTSYLATHPARAIDYFGRGMDYFTLRNYQAAIDDFERALICNNDFALAYFMRGVARWKQHQADQASATTKKPTGVSDPALAEAYVRKMELNAVIDDLDKALAISPSMAMAWYNKGCVQAAMGEFGSAVQSFDRAIRLRPDMGEAYYNRGYARMMMGEKSEAFNDLSRAGQLGIAPAYNVIKRMSR